MPLDAPLPPDIEDRIRRLSDRESQCLERAAKRIPYKVIAHELSVSEGTIDGYLSSGSRKLGLARRDALRLFAMRGPGNPGAGKPGIVPLDVVPATTKAPLLRWPFPTRARPDNDLTASQTLVAILIATSILLAGLALLMLATKIISQPG